VFDVSGKTIVPGFVDTQRALDGNPARDSGHAKLVIPREPGLRRDRRPGRTGPARTICLRTKTWWTAATSSVLRAFSTGPGVFSDNNFQSAEDVKGVLTKYKKYYGTHNIKSYVVGNRKQRQYMVQASKELEMMPTTEGALDLKLNLTHVIDGFHGNEHTLPITTLYNDVIQMFAKSGIAETPTLIVNYGGPFGEDYWFENSEVHDNVKLNHFMPHRVIDQRTKRRQGWFRKDEYEFPKLAAQMAKLARAGRPRRVGSHGEMQGIGYHWELWMLASGGMTPLEVLRCATVKRGQDYRRPADLGSIEPGKLAGPGDHGQEPASTIFTTPIRFTG